MALSEGVLAGRGIVTPQGVILDLETAGVGYRGAARFVDSLLFLLLAGGGVAFTEAVTTGTLTNVLLLLFFMFLLFAYPLVCEAWWRGRTVGKAIFGLRVVTLEAGPIGFREAFIRSLFQLIDFGTYGVVAVLTGMATSRSQRLGDVAAGTMVIREPRSLAHVPPVAFTPPMGWEARVAELDVSQLRPAQERLIRSFLLRVGQLSRDARVDLGRRLAETTARRLAHDLLTWPDAEIYLASVLAARQIREGDLVAALLD